MMSPGTPIPSAVPNVILLSLVKPPPELPSASELAVFDEGFDDALEGSDDVLGRLNSAEEDIKGGRDGLTVFHA